MPEIPIDVIEKIKQRDLQNIAKQAQEGRALSSAQMKRLESAAETNNGQPVTMLSVEQQKHVSHEVLSQLIGIKSRRIQQLAGEGVIIKAGHGHYPFPQAVQQYCEYLRGGGERDDSKLKNRELELKCRRLEQTINEYDMARRDDIETECWQDMQDFLAEYASELKRCDLTAEQRGKLNNALKEAADRVENAKSGQNVSRAT